MSVVCVYVCMCVCVCVNKHSTQLREGATKKEVQQYDSNLREKQESITRLHTKLTDIYEEMDESKLRFEAVYVVCVCCIYIKCVCMCICVCVCVCVCVRV